LLERSGAYHHILPPIDDAAATGNRVLAVRADDRAFCEELGREWLAAILDAQTKTTNDVRSKVVGVRAKIEAFWKELY
ncbi:hypothetical protein, partial [Stenotrophomonas maltophilia]|uniref:hypothetical protein n=1 Tax=Stenotrophomonas maltophilia TaxID=40324 RepID=UPI0013D9E3A2